MTRDLRKYARQTNVRLVAGALFLIFIIGDGLIYLFYGSSAALLGLLCLLAGLTPVLLIVFVLLFFDWIRKRANRD
jgi:TM2 domain-containing membrane protein YozV